MVDEPRLKVVFFKTKAGNEPVREWLKALAMADKKAIGEDIKTVQFSWPIGMPIVRKFEPDLWEVRSNIKNGIARIFFTVLGEKMVLLHGFIKKSAQTPLDDLSVARRRLMQLKGEK